MSRVDLNESWRSVVEVGLPLVSYSYYTHQLELHHLEEILRAFRKAIDRCIKYRYDRELFVVFFQLDVVCDTRPVWIGDFAIPQFSGKLNFSTGVEANQCVETVPEFALMAAQDVKQFVQ